LVGLGSAIGDKAATVLRAPKWLSGEATVPGAGPVNLQPAAHPYRDARAEYLADETKAADAHPNWNMAGQIAGGIVPSIALSPLAGAATKAAQGGGMVARVAARVAAPMAEGAIYGAGNTREDDPIEMGKNAAYAAGTTGVVAGAGELAKEGVKRAAGVIMKTLPRRILNEVAEGQEGRVSPTVGKKLDKAEKSIVKEILTSPDADAVRAAYQSGAKVGREKLAPIIDRVGRKNDVLYGKFEKSGTDQIDLASHQQRLTKMADEARKAGRARQADAIQAFQAKLQGEAGTTGGMTLRQLRGLTTEAQEHAASVIGSINETANAKLARRVSAAATEALDDTLTATAGGNKELLRAADQIRKNNERFHALLAIDTALEFRQAKAATGRSGLVRMAEKISHPAALAGGGGAAFGALQGESLDDKINHAGAGLAVMAGAKMLPAAARAIDRHITTAAIQAARNKMPLSVNGAAEFAAAVARARAGSAAQQSGGPGHFEVSPEGRTSWVPD
jgi:hypothetical protein